VHALEINGLRSWKENQKVIWLGKQTNLPVVSGGDRHGTEPNAVLNLTCADNFADFVQEVRLKRRSHVVFMPQYHEPLKLRILQTMADVVRDYPTHMGCRRTWSDRVFYRATEDSAPVALSTLWGHGGPKVVRHFIAAMRLSQSPSVRSALRLALNDKGSVWSDREVAI